MKRKVCVVTGSRAEYGLLRWVMEGIRDSATLELQVIVTGMHLAPRFGSTSNEIERDGIAIDLKVDLELDSDTPTGIAKSMGLGLAKFGVALDELKPDVMVVLGDRFELLVAVAAAQVARVPVAHLHGGELTAGAFDDAFRHAITKMSHLHFVAAEAYRKRVIQLGEQPSTVFLVGGLGLDGVRRIELLDRAALESELEFTLAARNLLVTFHPVTLDEDAGKAQMTELLAALDEVADTNIIFTMPNADTGGSELAGMVEKYVATRPHARAYVSLGQLRYLSCIAQADAVVGNSSSGLIEAPAFRKGTVNIGDRQSGRLRAASVIDCEPNRKAIVAAVEQIYSPRFREKLASVVNPYGEGGASEKIVKVLEEIPLEGILKKSFYDLQ